MKGKDAMTRRTHAKTRLSLPHGRQSLRAPLPRILSFVLLAALAACSSSNKPDLEAPRQILAPYDPMAGEVLWAIAPLRNETGTSLLDPLEVSDEIVAAAEQVQGVRALPLNRSLEAMRALELAQISTPAEARQLAQLMGADAVLTGTITAWDPYDPPEIGLTLALFAGPEPSLAFLPQADQIRALEAAPTDQRLYRTSQYQDRPASVASAHLDAKNHQVLMDLRSYAQGRHDPESALGWRRYLTSVDFYTEFAAWHVLRQLVDEEWQRLARERQERSDGNRT